MSTINPAAATTSTSSTPSTTPAQPGGALDKDAFLKIMMAQLQNQDPLSAQSQDPTQYVNELSQMTTPRADDQHGELERQGRRRAAHRGDAGDARPHGHLP